MIGVKPPVGARVQLAHPLATGMSFLCLGNEGKGQTCNLVNPRERSFSVDNWWGTHWGSGPVRAVFSNADSTSLGTPTATSPFTALILCRIDRLCTTYNGDIFNRGHWASFYDNAGWSLYEQYGASHKLALGLWNNNNYTKSTNYILQQGGLYWIFARYAGPTYLGTSIGAFLHGTRPLYASATIESGMAATATGNAGVASCGGNSIQTAAIAYFWQRAISDSELLKVTSDPFSMLERPRMEILRLALPATNSYDEIVSVLADAAASSVDAMAAVHAGGASADAVASAVGTQTSVESVTVQADAGASAPETMAATDAGTASADGIALAVQTTAFAETVFILADGVAGVTDLQASSESVVAEANTLAACSDVLVLSEPVLVVADAAALAIDARTVSETVAVTATAEAIQSDVAAFVEAVSASADAATDASDSPDLSEVASVEAQAVSSVVDSLQAAESVLCEATVVCLAVDAAIFADAVSAQAQAECSVLESTAPSEVVSCGAAGTASASDSLAGFETAAVFVGAQTFAVETVAYGEIVAIECFAVTTAADLGLFTESVLVQADTVGSAFDTIPAGGALIQTFLLIQKTR